jgi:hypothetical protein
VIERELAAREARLAARERELAEQQRILTEQYRLLKARESRSAATAPAATWPPKQPAVTVPSGATTVRVAAPAGVRLGVSHHPLRTPVGFWARVRRAMGGLGKPLLED